jgi:hypothetical protein
MSRYNTRQPPTFSSGGVGEKEKGMKTYQQYIETKRNTRATSQEQAKAQLAMLEAVPVNKRDAEWHTRYNDLVSCIQENQS